SPAADCGNSLTCVLLIVGVVGDVVLRMTLTPHLAAICPPPAGFADGADTAVAQAAGAPAPLLGTRAPVVPRRSGLVGVLGAVGARRRVGRVSTVRTVGAVGRVGTVGRVSTVGTDVLDHDLLGPRVGSSSGLCRSLGCVLLV